MTVDDARGGDAGSSDSLFTRERLFHDSWASSVAADRNSVRRLFESITAPENRFILGQMGPLEGKRILDVGSGPGDAAVYFALRGAVVTATDLSPEMCALCARTAESNGVAVETVVTPVERLDVPPESYDFVYGANLLHHVADLEATLAAVSRALRPGGSCFFWDPLAYNPVIEVYRRLARRLHTEDEHALRFDVLRVFRGFFSDVRHAEFWLTTQALFLKYYLLDGLDPNEVRYWRQIYEEDPERIRWWFGPLQRLDGVLLRLPLLRRLAWNTVIWARKPL
jgi:SAM-dependent methyltransferase